MHALAKRTMLQPLQTPRATQTEACMTCLSLMTLFWFRQVPLQGYTSKPRLCCGDHGLVQSKIEIQRGDTAHTDTTFACSDDFRAQRKD